jgi:hypothetical protein
VHFLISHNADKEIKNRRSIKSGGFLFGRQQQGDFPKSNRPQVVCGYATPTWQGGFAPVASPGFQPIILYFWRRQPRANFSLL